MKIQRNNLRSSPFWDVTQHRLAVSYWRFGTTYQFHLQGLFSPRRIYSFIL